MIVMVVVEENDMMVDLANVDSNIDDPSSGNDGGSGGDDTTIV